MRKQTKQVSKQVSRLTSKQVSKTAKARQYRTYRCTNKDCNNEITTDRNTLNSSCSCPSCEEIMRMVLSPEQISKAVQYQGYKEYEFIQE